MGLDIKIVAGSLYIKSIDFCGLFVRSPSGNFMFGCASAHWRVSAQSRERIKGRVALVHDGELLWQRQLERPSDCAVSDTGHTIVSDWGFEPIPRGTFYAFDPEGKVVVQHDVSAHLHTAGITIKGTLAWCTTALSENAEYNNKLLVFSLSSGQLLLKTIRPPWEWEIQRVEVVGHNIQVTTSGALYMYDQSGVLLNEWEVTKALFQHYKIYGVLRNAEERTSLCPPERMPQEEIETLLAALQRVSSADDDVSGYWKAKAQRKAGEISLACGENNNALAHFRKALGFDPKVGVAKLVRKLERELGPA